MLKKLLLLTVVVFAANFATAQTVAELKSQKADKDAKIAALQGEADALAAQIATFPGWKTGALGTLGANFSNCLLYTSPSPRDATLSRMPSSA